MSESDEQPKDEEQPNDQGQPKDEEQPKDQEPEAAEGAVEVAPEQSQADPTEAADEAPQEATAEQGGEEAEAAPESAGEAPQEATADQAAPAERPDPDRDSDKKEKKKDIVPGADLEPIAIEDERELTAEERAAREAEEEERAAREAAAAADHEDDDAIATRKVTVSADAHIQATGKRKSAVARVLVNAGSGAFKINDRPIEDYFPSTQLQSLARQPLVSAGYDKNVDVRVRVHGGGISGQAGAVRHGLARALTTLEPELRGELKRRGMLTRDDRRKERKKAGLKKARKRPQFSKR